MRTGLCLEPKGRDRLEDLGLEGSAFLKWI